MLVSVSATDCNCATLQLAHTRRVSIARRFRIRRSMLGIEHGADHGVIDLVHHDVLGWICLRRMAGNDRLLVRCVCVGPGSKLSSSKLTFWTRHTLGVGDAQCTTSHRLVRLRMFRRLDLPKSPALQPVIFHAISLVVRFRLLGSRL